MASSFISFSTESTSTTLISSSTPTLITLTSARSTATPVGTPMKMAYLHTAPAPPPATPDESSQSSTMPIAWVIVIAVLSVVFTAICVCQFLRQREFEHEYTLARRKEPDLNRVEFRKWWKNKRKLGETVEVRIEEHERITKPSPLLWRESSPRFGGESSPIFRGELSPMFGREPSPLLGRQSSPSWEGSARRTHRESLEISDIQRRSRIINVEDLPPAHGLGLMVEAESPPVSPSCIRDPPPAYTPQSFC